MIPQVLSLIQRTHAGPAPGPRDELVLRGAGWRRGGGQLVGGLLISANLFGSSWRPVFLVNVPVGVALLAVGARALPHGKGEPGRTLDLSGLALLTPAVLAFASARARPARTLAAGAGSSWPRPFPWGRFVLAERRGAEPAARR